jgi:hypothetical protein
MRWRPGQQQQRRHAKRQRQPQPRPFLCRRLKPRHRCRLVLRLGPKLRGRWRHRKDLRGTISLDRRARHLCRPQRRRPRKAFEGSSVDGSGGGDDSAFYRLLSPFGKYDYIRNCSHTTTARGVTVHGRMWAITDASIFCRRGGCVNQPWVRAFMAFTISLMRSSASPRRARL